MSALTKADLAETLHTMLGLNKREAKEFIETFYEEIRATLAEGEAVKLSGFGSLIPRDKKARPGRNPKTGVEVEISGRRVVIFRPGQKLRSRVEQHVEQASTEDESNIE